MVAQVSGIVGHPHYKTRILLKIPRILRPNFQPKSLQNHPTLFRGQIGYKGACLNFYLNAPKREVVLLVFYCAQQLNNQQLRMETQTQLIQIKRCPSNLPTSHWAKASTRVSNDTVTSSTQLSNQPRKEKGNFMNRSIEEQIFKAKMLISHVKHRVDHQKTTTNNLETVNPALEPKQKHHKFQIPNPTQKGNSPRSNSHQHHPTVFSLVTPPTPQDQSKKRLSPKRKATQSLQSPFSKARLEVQNLQQARMSDSFILDEDDELQVSIVEGHADTVLNWAVCEGKASEFKILKFVDEGKFGKVYLAQSHRNAAIYSIKSIYRSTLDSNNMQQLIREVKIQSFIDHPNIIKIYNFFVDQDSAYLVLQPCLGGNLFNYLKKQERISQKQVKEWIKQICSAVQYLHKNDIIHRDLKPQNILLHENMIKICDFGWAVHSPLMRGTLCGTPLYTSPEIVSKKPYDSKIDIWSIGVLTYELLYGNIPFEIRHLDDMAKIVEQEVFFSQETMVSEAAKDFMGRCMSKNPAERPTVRQLLEHEFLNKLDKYRWTIQ